MNINKIRARRRNRELTRRGIAVATITTAATLGLGLATAQAQGSSAAPRAEDHSAVATATADAPLWFIKARHTGLSMVPTVTAQGLGWEQRKIPSTYNPLFSGELYFFHNAISDSYVVESNGDGCLDIADGISTAVGAKLSVRQCDGTTSQRWESHFRDGGWYLKNEWSGLYATLDDYAQGSNAVQRADLGSSHPGISRQRFNMPLFTG